MSDKIVYLTRHCQAEHNVASDWYIPDAPLTKLGRQQAESLHASTRDNIQKEFDVIISSPLRRTLQTTLDGYPDAIERLGGKSKVVLLPAAQECNSYPCDNGSPLDCLERIEEFRGLNFQPLIDAPDWTSKQGFYADDVQSLRNRARFVRRFIRERPEKVVVLIAHGDFLRYLTKNKQDDSPWANAEVRKYRFEAEGDKDALLQQIEVEAVEGSNKPTSSGE